MPTVSKQHFEQGDIPTASELNASYNALETASVIVDADNTASGWANIKHFDTSAQQCNRLYSYSYDSSGSHTINSATYVTITVVGPAEIDLTGFEPDSLEATRWCASGLVTTTSLATDEGATNYYAFRLLLTYDDGAGDVTEVIGEWGYSFTARSLVTTEPGSTADQIKYQTFQFSAVRRYGGNTGVREYKKIELQAAVNDITNSVTIGRHQIFAISGRR